MTAADAAIRFVESLKVPEGPLAGRRIKLAEYQKRFIRGAYGEGISIGVFSAGRGSAKTMIGAALALGTLIGKIEPQPRREIAVAAKVRDQSLICFRYIEGLAASLPVKVRKQLTFVKAPRLEVRFDGDGGGHSIRVLASDAKNALGLSCVLVVEDERGAWNEKGDGLEAALLGSLGKRNGRALIFSTSAPTDSHALSRMLDSPAEGMFCQEHKAPDNCVPDDIEAIKAANPGAVEGIGASLEWLQAAARRAMQRGGSALAAYRLYHLNIRCSDENRAVLIDAARWQACEVDTLPERAGPVICGLDLGGSASMSAWCNFWPATGRLEAWGAFGSSPSLVDRGRQDGVGDRYSEMHRRDELMVCGQNVVDVSAFIAAMVKKLDGIAPAALVADRFRASELQEALSKTSVRCPVVFRGMGWKDGSEDVERFRAFVFDGKVKTKASLLLRSAFGDAITVIDHAGNHKITKSKSLSRIDAACAATLAIAEGSRLVGRGEKKPTRWAWA